MPLFVRFVLLVLLCVCSVVLGGCTSSRITLFDGDPYTPNDVKEMVEERFSAYNPRLVLQSSRVVSTKPNGGQRVTKAEYRYADTYLNHLNSEVALLATKYRFHIANDEERKALISAKLMRPDGNSTAPLFDEGDFVFLNQTSNGAGVVGMLRDIYSLYKPNGDETLVSSVYGRKVSFYYLPNGETDKSKALYLISFKIRGREDWRDTLMSGVGYQDKSSEQIERHIITVVDREIQQAVRGK
ncbi:MAG: hypothetical protein KHW74_08390 [Veillonella sp.]|nr:hypothetical protein [Veillonella sp.]